MLNDIILRNTLLFSLMGNFLYFIFPFPSIIWRIVIVLLCLICIYRNLRYYGLKSYEKYILFFYILNFIYFFISLFYHKTDTWIIGGASIVMLSFISFSYFGKCGIINQKFLQISAILLICVSILLFLYSKKIGIEEHYGNDVTVNQAGMFLMLLPMVIYLRNRIVSSILFVICLFFLIAGAKRGYIIASLIPICIYVYILFKESKGKWAVIKKILICFFLIVIVILAYHQITSNNYFLNRVEQTLEGNSSGRFVLYNYYWDKWYSSEHFINKLFGYGYHATRNSPYPDINLAHNDWLEILVDYGFVGAISYLLIFISFFKASFKVKDFHKRYVIFAIISIWFMETFYSMAFFERSFSLLAIPFSIIYEKQLA